MLNKRWIALTCSVTVLSALSAGAFAQTRTNVESRLLGINLFDTGVRVVSVYGSPDAIEAIAVATQNQAGRGQGGALQGGELPPGFDPGLFGPDGLPPGFQQQRPPLEQHANSFNFGDVVLQQQARERRARGNNAPGQLPGARPDVNPAGAGQAANTQFTRWIYNRNGSKYGFVIDNNNRVVQIEAIGMQNKNVRTSRGLGFGSNFATIMKTYGNPDGYEISGDTILIRYLRSRNVAFRLNRLTSKKPHVVTGVVVAAGTP